MRLLRFLDSVEQKKTKLLLPARLLTQDSKVEIGSALCGINGVDISLLQYYETVSKLANWTPPLTLTFRRAPQFKGILNKESRQRRGKNKSFKSRYFVLGEGHLRYFIDEIDAGEPKGDIRLQGSAVTLIPYEDSKVSVCIISDSCVMSFVAFFLHDYR